MKRGVHVRSQAYSRTPGLQVDSRGVGYRSVQRAAWSDRRSRLRGGIRAGQGYSSRSARDWGRARFAAGARRLAKLWSMPRRGVAPDSLRSSSANWPMSLHSLGLTLWGGPRSFSSISPEPAFLGRTGCADASGVLDRCSEALHAADACCGPTATQSSRPANPMTEQRVTPSVECNAQLSDAPRSWSSSWRGLWRPRSRRHDTSSPLSALDHEWLWMLTRGNELSIRRDELTTHSADRETELSERSGEVTATGNAAETDHSH